MPCDHPSIEKEYERGGHTGDYVCSTCGKTFSAVRNGERGILHRTLNSREMASLFEDFRKLFERDDVTEGNCTEISGGTRS